jgi:putative colanic acid biosynthesis acetyltransferase WcaF
MSGSSVDLSTYTADGFDRGRGPLTEVLWRLVSALVFQSPCFPFYAPKRWLLRLFGARVGRRVLVKPRVTITFPWKLALGDQSWIGEGSWLDSLDRIEIGPNVCISQGAYLCTGNHDHSRTDFALRTAPVRIGDGAWIAARAVVGPGVTVGERAILSLGSVAVSDLEPDGIYKGNPAAKAGTRSIP